MHLPVLLLHLFYRFRSVETILGDEYGAVKISRWSYVALSIRRLSEKLEVYERGPPKEWKSREELESFAVGQNFEAGADILGHISEETVQVWLGWHPGKLYVVGLGWSFVFCIEWGYLV